MDNLGPESPSGPLLTLYKSNPTTITPTYAEFIHIDSDHFAILTGYHQLTETIQNLIVNII